MDELDPRKLYELSESLNELTGTVKYASTAMQSMLGPQAEANKKLRESGKNRAKVEEQAAQQQAKQLSRQEEADVKQKKLLDDELRYRGYKIDATGNLSKTTTRLTGTQKQSLETLDKRIAKERELAEVVKDPVKAFRNVANSVNSFDGIMALMQEEMFEMTGKSVPLAAGLIAATAVVGGVVKAATGMADALYKGERGAKVGAQAVKELNDSVTKAAYGIGAALMFIPGLGVAAKVLGVAVAAFGLAMEGSTKLIEMGAKYNDDVYKSFNELSEAGLTTSKGMSGVSTTMEKLGLTSAEIEKMNSLLVSGSKDLAMFGGTAAGGLEKFTEIAGKIASPASELNKKLMLLGISSDQQREHTLKYMATQTRMGMMQGKTQADLVKGATAYMEELDRIATITGIGRKEQEEAQKAVLSIENLRAAMFQAERSGDTKRQKELETAFKYSSRLMAEGRKKEAAGVAKYYAAGKNVVDAESAMAMQNSAGAIKAIGEGKEGEDVYQAGIESAKESARRTAGTKAIGGDVSNLIGDFNATLDAIKRTEKAQEEMKKLGIKSPEEYAKRIQKEKEEKPDPSLAKNVEAMQIQQKAGLTLDQAAKLMDGAGLAMASSVKAFNEAVKLFGQASGTGPSQGTAIDKAKEADTAALNKQQSAMDANKKTQNDPTATKAQKEAAQKSEDEANKESMKAMAAKREAFLKEQNELRELNKKQRIAGREVFKTMEDARKAGAAPASAPAVAPASAPASAPVEMGNEGRRGATPVPSTTPATGSDTHSESAPGANDKKDNTVPASPTPTSNTTLPPTAVPSVEVTKIDKEIARFKQNNNMSLQSNKDYVAKLEAKTGKPVAPITEPAKAAPVAAPVSLKSSSTKSDLLIANEPVTADKPLSSAQMSMIEFGVSQGNKFPDMVMQKFNSQMFGAKPVAPTSAETIPINKAMGGGIFDGPGSNSVMLNNNSMPANDILTSLRQSFGSVQKKSIESEVPKLTKFNTMTPSGRGGSTGSSMDILEKFTDIMEQKMSDVISAISDNNDLKEEILLYSKV
jgi:hypothetical protein